MGLSDKIDLLIRTAERAVELDCNNTLTKYQPKVELVLRRDKDFMDEACVNATIRLVFDKDRSVDVGNWNGIGGTLEKAIDYSLRSLQYELKGKIHNLTAMLVTVKKTLGKE